MSTAPTIETERLTLRAFGQDDVQDFADYLVSDAWVMATLPEVRVDDPDEQRSIAQEYIDDALKPWREGGIGAWAVCLNRSDSADSVVGFCGFFASKLESPDPELGYALARQWWGQGLVSEATTAAVSWAFANTGIHGVYAVTFEENRASQAVLRKLGFEPGDGVDLYNSVRDGRGLMRYFYLERDKFSQTRD